MAPFKALYRRKCLTPYYWVDLTDRLKLGAEIIQETIEKIKKIHKRLKAVNQRNERYVNQKKRDLKFEVGSKVWLKVPPTKGVMRFRKKQKIVRRFIGPYKVL